VKLGELIEELTELRDRYGWDVDVQACVPQMVEISEVRYSTNADRSIERVTIEIRYPERNGS
jgi:hypothetical protein